jgi:hypothetical protein
MANGKFCRFYRIYLMLFFWWFAAKIKELSAFQLDVSIRTTRAVIVNLVTREIGVI